MKLAIVPGSFDPMTLGHLELVKKALKRYDEVVVAVMINPSKRYLFDMDTRVEIAKRTVSDYPNVRVIAERGMLINLYDRLGASAVCKGWRNESDYFYELRMADWNREHNSRFRTEMIYAYGDMAEISSTKVRESLANGISPEDMIHPLAMPLVIGKLVEKGEV